MAGDLLTTLDDAGEGEALILPVVRAGKRVEAPPSLAAIRAHAAENLARLPEPLRRLELQPYPVSVSSALKRLAAEVDARLATQEESA